MLGVCCEVTPVMSGDPWCAPVEVKADIVSRDEFESGRRAILNWGHTVAHALELDSGYRLAHGCAVAIGMVAEARICEALGITEAGTSDAIRVAVCAFGLPHDCDAFGRPERLLRLMRRDKKTRRGIVHLAHLPRIGCGGAGGKPTIPVAAERPGAHHGSMALTPQGRYI